MRTRRAEGCYSNYVRLADLDGDGDLDVVFANGGGYFAPGVEAGLQPLVVYRNDGSAGSGPVFTDVSADAVGGFRGRLRQVAVGDVDGDGDLDLYAPGSWGETDALFVNDGTGHFTDEAAARLPAGLASRAGATRFGDVDGDGDLDLVVTDWGETPPTSPGTARLYLNDGAGVFTDATDRLPGAADPPLGTGPVDVDFVDVDGDLDLDLILNNRDGRNLLWRNDGSGRFVDATDPDLPAKPSAMSYDVEPCDVDGDGDLDLWVDNAGVASAEQLLINDGGGRFADESAARIAGNPPGDDNEVTCADVDGDGDFDAVIAALQGNDRVLINDGAGRFTAKLDAFPTLQDPSLSMELGDLDGDGILDAVTAQGESQPQLQPGLPRDRAGTRRHAAAGPAAAADPDDGGGRVAHRRHLRGLRQRDHRRRAAARSGRRLRRVGDRRWGAGARAGDLRGRRPVSCRRAGPGSGHRGDAGRGRRRPGGQPDGSAGGRPDRRRPRRRRHPRRGDPGSVTPRHGRPRRPAHHRHGRETWLRRGACHARIRAISHSDVIGHVAATAESIPRPSLCRQRHYHGSRNAAWSEKPSTERKLGAFHASVVVRRTMRTL